uniref:Uncharacterized protein n=1 Tax=Tolypothrix bouteillei VB521301 TaxID=1479485 RepID=A0A0C1NBZ1_9CYAN
MNNTTLIFTIVLRNSLYFLYNWEIQKEALWSANIWTYCVLCIKLLIIKRIINGYYKISY